MLSVITALTGTVKEREREVQVSDPCLASNRLIDSSWNLQRDSSIPKAKSVGQLQPTSSGPANYYAARW